MKNRITELESLVQSLQNGSGNGNGNRNENGGPRRTEQPSVNRTLQSEDESNDESDTEEAASVLEQLATTGLPSLNSERKAALLLPSLRDLPNDRNYSAQRNGTATNGNGKDKEFLTLPSLPSLNNFSAMSAPPSNPGSQDSQVENCLMLLPKMKDLLEVCRWYLEEVDPILACLNR